MSKDITPEAKAFVRLVHAIEIELACAQAFDNANIIDSLEHLLNKAENIWENR